MDELLEVDYDLAAPEDVPASPIVVCLIGSSRFKEHHELAQAEQTLLWRVVLPMGLYGHRRGLDMASRVKANLDVLHLRKIDMANLVYVVNPPVFICKRCSKIPDRIDEDTGWTSCCQAPTMRVAYVGDSTKREIEYALSKGKTVKYMYNPLTLERWPIQLTLKLEGGADGACRAG